MAHTSLNGVYITPTHTHAPCTHTHAHTHSHTHALTITHTHTHIHIHTHTHPHTPGKRADPGAGAVSTRQQPIHNPATDGRGIGRGGCGQGRRRRFNADLGGQDDFRYRTAHIPNSPTASSRFSFALPYPPLLPVPARLPSACNSLPFPSLPDM
jgi:hypothetical protein